MAHAPASASAPGSARRRHAGDRISESDDSATQRSHTPTFSLAVKVSVAVTGVMAVLVLLFTWMGHVRSRAALDREVDAFGVALVKTMASVDVSIWAPSHGSLAAAAEQVVASKDEFSEYLREKYAIDFSPADPSRKRENLSEAFVKQQDLFLSQFEEVKRRNSQRLAALTLHTSGDSSVASEVVDAFVLKEEGQRSLVRARPDSGEFRTSDPGLHFRVEGENGEIKTDTMIRRGRIATVGNVRSFAHPIVDMEGKLTHTAYAFISTAWIDAQLTTLWKTQLGWAALLVLLAGAFCYAVTRFVTAPIKELVGDADLVAAGHLDHRTHVHTDDEIGILARTMDVMVGRLNQARVSHDREIASDVHRKLSPEAVPYVPGYPMDVVHKLMEDFGGAYYDFIELSERRIGIVVAQGSKKGVAAAVNLVMAGTALRSEGHRTDSPVEIIKGVNATLYENIHEEMHVSALLAVLDPSSGELTVCGAGDLPMVHYRAAAETLDVIVPQGVALGVDAGPKFDNSLETRRIQLNTGDRVFFSNGGAPTLKNMRGEALGEVGLKQIFKQAALAKSGDLAGVVRQGISDFLGPARADHDVVIVILAKDTD